MCGESLLLLLLKHFTRRVGCCSWSSDSAGTRSSRIEKTLYWLRLLLHLLVWIDHSRLRVLSGRILHHGLTRHAWSWLLLWLLLIVICLLLLLLWWILAHSCIWIGLVHVVWLLLLLLWLHHNRLTRLSWHHNATRGLAHAMMTMWMLLHHSRVLLLLLLRRRCLLHVLIHRMHDWLAWLLWLLSTWLHLSATCH